MWIEQRKRDGWGWDHNVPPIEHADDILGFEFFTLFQQFEQRDASKVVRGRSD